jgi:hypothetical protein
MKRNQLTILKRSVINFSDKNTLKLITIYAHKKKRKHEKLLADFRGWETKERTETINSD